MFWSALIRGFLCLSLCSMLLFPMQLSGQRIDSTFGVNGFLQPELYAEDDSIPAWGFVRELPNGKLMVAGFTNQTMELRDITTSGQVREEAADLWIRRLNSDGTSDRSFAVDGIKILPLGFEQHVLYDFKLIPGGGMILLFRLDRVSFKVLVLNADGDLDPNYGDNGHFIFERGGDIFSGKVILLPNDQIIAAGTSDRSFFAVKFNKDGSRATPFGTQGYFFIRTERITNGGNRIKFLELDGDYHVLAGGGEYPSVLFRLHVDGFLDRYFGDEGVYEDDRAKFFDLKRKENGEIVVLHPFSLSLLSQRGVFIRKTLLHENSQWPISGTMNHIWPTDSGKWLITGWSGGQMMVARLDSTFMPDNSYGYRGFRRLFYGGANLIGYFNSCHSLDRGLVFSSYSGIAKFDSIGGLESSFGSNGYLSLSMPYSHSFWNVLQSDEAGDIWVAGGNGQGNLALGHFGKDGGSPSSSGLQGTHWLNTPRFKDPKRGNLITDMTWGLNQNFFLSGRLDKNGFVQKYNADGEQDLTFGTVENGQIVDQAIMMPDQKVIFTYRDLPLEGQPNFIPRTHVGKVSYNGNPEPTFDFDGELKGTPLAKLEYSILGISAIDAERFWICGVTYEHLTFRQALADGKGDHHFGSYMIEEDSYFEREGTRGITVHPSTLTQSLAPNFYHRFKDGKVMTSSTRALARFLPSGELDSSFSDKGWRELEKILHQNFYYLEHVSMTMNVDSTFIIWGNLEQWSDTRSNIFLARYCADGSLDTTMGNDGLFILDRPAYSDVALAVHPQSDSTLLIAGISNARMIVTRVLLPECKSRPTIPDTIPSDTSSVEPPLTESKIFPNPTQSHQVNIQFQVNTDQKVNISLYSIKGQLMQPLLSAERDKGIHHESLELPQNIYPGTYLIRLRLKESESWHKLVLLP